MRLPSCAAWIGPGHGGGHGVTVELDRVQTAEVVEGEAPRSRPGEAVALTGNGRAPNLWNERAAKVMVWPSCVTWKLSAYWGCGGIGGVAGLRLPGSCRCRWRSASTVGN